MSRAGARADREDSDNYPTPRWCVGQIVRALERSYPDALEGTILDPCAGDGNILDVLKLSGYERLRAVELRPECEEPLVKIAGKGNVLIGDFLAERSYHQAPGTRGDLGLGSFGDEGLDGPVNVVMNPPYTLAREFVEACLDLEPVRWVTVLLRVGFLESAERADWWPERPPVELFALQKRPSFTRDGGTDGATYGWFVWRRDVDGMLASEWPCRLSLLPHPDV